VAPLPELLALTPYVALTAVAALGVAVAARRPAAVVVAALLVVAHAVMLAPRWTAEPRPAGGTPVRVMTANLHYGTADPSRVIALVRAERPDILVLVELTPRSAVTLDRAGLRRELPERVPRARTGGAGTAIYARVPVRPAGRAHTRFESPRATLELGGRTLTVQATHPAPPVPRHLAPDWRRDLDAVRAAVTEVRGPLVVMGDFNATLDHPRFRSILGAADLRDAHDALGRGLVGTWPEDSRVPAFAHLDHVLVSRELSVRRVREHPLPGSDHRAVVADLTLLD
jgi:endonuclease/exonuclease/phosphatase (EEP) superfamily protein YafD